MSHRVALCGDFGGEVDEVADREQKDEIRADFGKHPRNTETGSSEDFRGSKIKQEKMRWVAVAPTSMFTSDGNADRVGVFGSFALDFSGWVAIRINAEFAAVWTAVAEYELR